jgi:hypothetical protein
MTIYPLQSFGIGDIIFTQTLIKEIAGGMSIVWGTEPQFIEGLNRAYPDMRFIDKKDTGVDYNRRDDYLQGDKRIIPIRWADVIRNVPYRECMRAKYDLYNMDWQRWKECAIWQRDITKERELYQMLNLEGRSYTLTNCTYGSEGKLHISIPIDGAVKMRTIDGYSLFDWAMVIEQASEIHTVSTSIIYLLELLDLKAREIHLYVRRPIEHNFDNVDYILQRHKYIFHY